MHKSVCRSVGFSFGLRQQLAFSWFLEGIRNARRRHRFYFSFIHLTLVFFSTRTTIYNSFKSMKHGRFIQAVVQITIFRNENKHCAKELYEIFHSFQNHFFRINPKISRVCHFFRSSHKVQIGLSVMVANWVIHLHNQWS